MSLIAGYFSRAAKLESSRLTRMVESFSIVSNDRPDEYQNTIIETKYGHVILKGDVP